MKHFQLHVIVGLRTQKNHARKPPKMSQQQVSGKKQQGNPPNHCNQNIRNRKIADNVSELQMQYSNFKDTLQNIASQIGNVEQEVEEHKYVKPS